MLGLEALRIRTRLWLLGGIGIAGAVVVALVALEDLRYNLLQDRKEKTREVVQLAHSTLAHYHQQARAGELSEEEARQAALETVRAMRYGESQYIWINDRQPRMVMHPMKPALEGQDLSDYTDPEGKTFFVEAVRKVRADGGGFVRYVWDKPDSGERAPKISYVMGFDPWGWVVGSGIYVDDVTAVFWEQAYKLLGFLAGILLVTGGGAFVIYRSITRPLYRLDSGVGRVEQGDLRETVRVGSPGVIGHIADSFNRMQSSLRDQIQEDRQEAELLASASEELTSTAQGIHENAQGASQRVEQVSHSAQEVNSVVQDVANNIQAVSDSASKTTDITKQGQEAVDSAAREIDGFKEATDQVTEIVGSIDAIAKQTDLLALNAAIEAANAGEQGKGFAVVADEVRKLAEQTSNATSRVHDIVDQLRGHSDSSVSAMNQVQTRMEDVLGSIEETDQLANQIAASAEELAATMSETTESMGDISRNVDQVADSVSQVQEAGKELEGMAARLRESFASYRL